MIPACANCGNDDGDVFVCNPCLIQLDSISERIKLLHAPYQYGLFEKSRICFECSGINRSGTIETKVRYPCPTVKALDSE